MQHLSKHKHTPGRSNGIFSGVFVLTVSNLIVKCIGLFFKIPISYILTDEGMGYFNAAYTIYTWLYMLSTAGVPVAISILVSKALAQGDMEKAESQRKTATRFFSLSQEQKIQLCKSALSRTPQPVHTSVLRCTTQPRPKQRL